MPLSPVTAAAPEPVQRRDGHLRWGGASVAIEVQHRAA